jgi:hypothetical protein
LARREAAARAAEAQTGSGGRVGDRVDARRYVDRLGREAHQAQDRVDQARRACDEAEGREAEARLALAQATIARQALERHRERRETIARRLAERREEASIDDLRRRDG